VRPRYARWLLHNEVVLSRPFLIHEHLKYVNVFNVGAGEETGRYIDFKP